MCVNHLKSLNSLISTNKIWYHCHDHIQFNWIVQRNLDNIISRINAFDSVRCDRWIKLSNILRVLIREISHCWKQCAIKKTWFDNGEKGIAWIFPSSYRVTIYNRDNGMRYSKLKGLVDSHTHIYCHILSVW